jgi:hypothetical protein
MSNNQLEDLLLYDPPNNNKSIQDQIPRCIHERKVIIIEERQIKEERYFIIKNERRIRRTKTNNRKK